MSQLANMMEATQDRVDYLAEPGLGMLVVRNLLLTIVTIGIYRFWARTRIRRYFWSNIVLGKERLEYTGTGRELFIGFLIVMAVLAPCSILFMVLLRVTLGNPVAAGILRLFYFLALFTLVQAAIFRARRYRLSRTSWRGIAAGQGGSTWRYIGLSYLCSLLCLVTAGLYVPWADMRLESYKINNSWFGNRPFSVDATGRALFRRWLVVMALFVLPFLLALAVNAQSFLAGMPSAAHPHPAPMPMAHPGVFALIPLSFLAGIPAFISYRLACFRYLASSTRLGDIRLTSDASSKTVIGLILAYCIYCLGLVLVFGAIFALTAGLMSSTLSGLVSPATAATASLAHMPAIVIAVGLFYLLMAAAFQTVSYCQLRAPIIQHLATTLRVTDFEAIESVLQSTAPRQKFGEGLADSFDLGGGL